MSSMIPIRSFLTSPAGSNRSPEGTYMNQNSQEYLHHFAQSSTVTSGMLFLRYLGISQASVHMEHWYWQSEGSGPNSSFIAVHYLSQTLQNAEMWDKDKVLIRAPCTTISLTLSYGWVQPPRYGVMLQYIFFILTLLSVVTTESPWGD
jgi:hypothetical protein